MPSSEVFRKFKAGQLHSGSKNGPVVTSRKQEIAIYLSERRNEEATGNADRPKRYGRPKRRSR